MPLTILSVAYPLAPVTRGTPGGAEQIVALLDDAFVRAGHRSLVVASERSQVRGELIPTPHVEGPFDERTRAAAHARHREAIARVVAQADVVHYHGLDFTAYDVDAELPKIVTLHLPPEWYPPSIFQRDDLTLVCVSESECARASRCDAVVPNGIDLEAFTPTSAARESDEPYALILGRICPEKNVHEAIDAARRAKLRVVIAGDVFRYADHEAYFDREIVPRLGGGAQFVGPVSMPRKRDLLANAACVLIASGVAETSSLTAMEALACGTPVIARAAGALPEIIGNGGVIVSSTDDMSDAILNLRSFDRTRCRVEAEGSFDAGEMAERYLNLYEAEIRPPVASVRANNFSSMHGLNRRPTHAVQRALRARCVQAPAQ